MKNSILKFFILNSTFLILLSTACSRKKEVPVDLGPAPAISDFVLKNLASEFPGEIQTAEYADKVQLVLFFRTDDPACRGAIAGWNGASDIGRSKHLIVTDKDLFTARNISMKAL